MKSGKKEKKTFRYRFAQTLQVAAKRQSREYRQDKPPESIVILAKECYGDCIMLTPLIGCLRKKYPAISIYILTFNKKIFDFFSADTNITAVYNTKKNPVRYYREILSKEFDLLFNPKDHPSTNFLIQTALVRARHKISHFNIYHEGLYDQLIRLDSSTHESSKNLSLINLVDGSSEVSEYKPYIPVMDVSADISRFLQTVDAGRNIGINISTGHSGGHRSVEQWSELINHFKNETFIIFSSAQDFEEKKALEQLHKNVQQSPATQNLYEVGEIVKNLKLLITPDTSLIHVASCFDTPLVGLYRQNPSDSTNFAPLSTQQEVIVSTTHDVIDINSTTINNTVEMLLEKLTLNDIVRQ
ncbi:MAG: glycosyltransferase family 9 protein [Chlorobiaceae bacterium]|nr:glycosyltransferase family 9 protein [Chlorobiaceae bacterium]